MTSNGKAIAFCCLWAAVFLGCGRDDAPGDAPARAVAARAAEQIDVATYRRHLETLSSDAFEGRGPGTPGAEKAREYLVSEMKRIGLRPALADSWFQPVPLRKVENTRRRMSVKGSGMDWTLRSGDEFVIENARGPGEHLASGELVFCGFGIQAPEYDWDDFKGLEVQGKVILVFVGDPPSPDASLFAGKAMTYYGRWTYKLEKAKELGAAGCLIIHRPDWAGYRWHVVENSWGGRHMETRSPSYDDELAFGGWVKWSVAEKLVQGTGESLDALAEKATRPGFEPIPLGLTVTAGMTTTNEDFDDENVAGVLEPTGPNARPDEWVIYTAHYDHLGIMPNAPAGADAIYNGAVDNASGCSGVLAIAEAFAALKGDHRRSVMFLFVCSEEQGLLGSRYYSEHPLVPIESTLCNINIDGLSVWEATTDLQVVGSGQSDLEDTLADVLAARGRTTAPDSESEKGYYYRSDHFNFARVGIPALYVKTGDRVPGKPAGYLRAIKDAWRNRDYHRVSDEYHPEWPLDGGVEDARALFVVGLRVARADSRPRWRPTSEFRSRR